MKINWLQKYALNLGWFLLLMGGISLLDRGYWTFAGLLLLLGGLLNLTNTIRLLYFGKTPFFVGIQSLYVLNIGGLIIMAAGHVFTVKKGISWELLMFFGLVLVFQFIAKAGSGNLLSSKDKKTASRL